MRHISRQLTVILAANNFSYIGRAERYDSKGMQPQTSLRNKELPEQMVVTMGNAPAVGAKKSHQLLGTSPKWATVKLRVGARRGQLRSASKLRHH